MYLVDGFLLAKESLSMFLVTRLKKLLAPGDKVPVDWEHRDLRIDEF